MKSKATIGFLLLSVFLSLALTGCGSWKRLMEDRFFRKSVDSFFTAVESKDAATIKSLFSKNVIENDIDLDEQITKLISIYPNAKTEILFEGSLGGSYENEEGEFKSEAYTTVPIICDNEYYWAFFELIYEDDFSEENIGLNRVFFYTADEYCAFFHNDDKNFPDELGLLVFSDLKLENEVRPIERFPYEFIPIERTIKVHDVETFLVSNKSWSKFTETFGQPNVKDFHWSYYYSYYYEITEKDGTVKYLELGVNDGKIEYASIVDEFEYIRCILEEEA